MQATIKYNLNINISEHFSQLVEIFYDISYFEKENTIICRYAPTIHEWIYDKESGKLCGWIIILEKLKESLDIAEITILEKDKEPYKLIK